MAKMRRDRRRVARRKADKGRWAARYAEEGGETVLVGMRWSLSSRPKPTTIRRAS